MSDASSPPAAYRISNHAFTCLLPVWEGDDPQLLDMALRSIAEASVHPETLLICEDGPIGEALGQVVDRWRANLPLRRLRNNGDRGLHFNLNNALGWIKTDWICRADADDWNYPDRFERQVERLRTGDRIDVLGTEIEELAPNGELIRKRMPQSHDQILRAAMYRNPVNHMTAFVRTDALRSVDGYPPLGKKEDYGLWLRLLAKGARFENLPVPLVRATMGDGFYARRAGLHNVATELHLARMKLAVPGMNPLLVAGAAIARIVALSGGRRLTTGVYKRLLR